MEMELLEKLNGLIDSAINYTSGSERNFLSVSLDFKNVRLHSTYEDAKRFSVTGGYVLVIDKQKVYTYKEKSQEEFMNYLRNEVRRERYNTMNKYGL